MKNILAKIIANMLPTRVVVWVIVRAYAYTSTHECSHKVPDEIGYGDVYKSWESRLGKKI